MMKNTDRLKAFTDGVLAIIITIMVLELDVPHHPDLAALQPLLPVYLSYILSFIYGGIYWNNHHHLFYITEAINGKILWANLHLLFWLSLFPFATAWMGENSFQTVPAALYGVILLLAALAWWILQRMILAEHPAHSLLAQAMGTSLKEKISPLLYVAAILLAFVRPWISYVIYGIVALIWVMPDPRIERVLTEKQENHLKIADK